MDDLHKRCTKIKRSLVKRAFPALRGERITVKERDATWRAHVTYLPWGMTIYVSTRMRGFPDNVLKRVILHELCHLEIFKSKGVVRTNLLYLLYRLSGRVRREVEAEADVRMIEKGYGDLVIQSFRDSKGRGLEFPLSMEEIGRHIRKFKGSYDKRAHHS